MNKSVQPRDGETVSDQHFGAVRGETGSTQIEVLYRLKRGGGEDELGVPEVETKAIIFF